jgi:hypothetical protein
VIAAASLTLGVDQFWGERSSQPDAGVGGPDRPGRGAFIAHVAVRRHPRRKHHHHDEQESGVDL